MRLIYLALFLLSTSFSTAQHSPIVTKVTATWCPNCGDWAWDFMELMKDDFIDGPMLILGVHHSGDLEAPVSLWWTQNLGARFQPLFYLDNESISASRTTWQTAFLSTKLNGDVLATSAPATLSYNTIDLDDEMLTVSANVEVLPTTTNNMFISTYIFENKVVNFQSQVGADAIHPNVLRAAMTDEFQGVPISDLGTYEFNYPLETAWNTEEVGIFTVIWEQVGNTYNILGTTHQSNISQLSSSEEILDSRIFSFRNAGNNFIVTAEDSDSYNLSLTDMTGKRVAAETFSHELKLDKTDLPTGMYVITLRSETGALSQQFFLN